MNLKMSACLADAYRSRSQQVRAVSEAWGERELYCANCDSPRLVRTPPNKRAVDFVCPQCCLPYQLKASRSPANKVINDGAFQAMWQAIQNDSTPNMLILHYAYPHWNVVDLDLIPGFALPESAIIKRPPLSANARRHGWVGCIIDLRRVVPDACIPLIRQQNPIPQGEVRAKYARLKIVQNLRPKIRGWTLDVLNIVRRLGKTKFTNEDIYGFTEMLRELHPENCHIKDKIRQQLQILRDMGFLEHTGKAAWVVKGTV